MPKKKFNEKTQPLQRTRVPNALIDQALDKLKAARNADPGWEKAIDACLRAEAALDPKDDPAEGKIVTAKIIPPKKGV